MVAPGERIPGRGITGPELVQQVLGNVALIDDSERSQFQFAPEGNYLYLPVADVGPNGEELRQVALFHATGENEGDLRLDTLERRAGILQDAEGWRRAGARGLGLTGANTPDAASGWLAKKTVSTQPRTVRMYLTDPVSQHEISDRRNESGYMAAIIRAQFDSKYAKQRVLEMTAARSPDTRVELLTPGLVSEVHKKTFVSGASPADKALEPTWISIPALPPIPGDRYLEHVGNFEGNLKVAPKTPARQIFFLGKVGARIAQRAVGL